ncbi:MAG: murein biosynthesis integral membrane protein MurJ, partial [Holosporales bacterium]
IGALTFGGAWFATPGHSLSWAVLIAGALQCVWMWGSASRAGAHVRLIWPRYTPAVQQLVRVMLPGAYGAGVVQVNLLIDTILASFLPTGSVSFLFYADRLNQLPLSVIGIAISTALLPQLSRHLQKGDQEKASHAQNRALELSMMLTLPATVGLVFLAHPIIAALFQRGAFGAYEVAETAKVLAAFAFGLPAYVLVKVFSTSFFATYDTKTPVKAALVGLAVNFVLNLILLQSLRHVGIALATAIAAWVNAGLLAYGLKRRQMFHRDEMFKMRFPGIVMATLVMAAVLSGIQMMELSPFPSGQLWRFAQLFLTITAAAAAYGAGLMILKVIEVRQLTRFFVWR